MALLSSPLTTPPCGPFQPCLLLTWKSPRAQALAALLLSLGLAVTQCTLCTWGEVVSTSVPAPGTDKHLPSSQLWAPCQTHCDPQGAFGLPIRKQELHTEALANDMMRLNGITCQTEEHRQQKGVSSQWAASWERLQGEGSAAAQRG